MALTLSIKRYESGQKPGPLPEYRRRQRCRNCDDLHPPSWYWGRVGEARKHYGVCRKCRKRVAWARRWGKQAARIMREVTRENSL